MIGVVDGTVCQRPFSGVAKYVVNLYDACHSLDPGIRFFVFRTRKLSSLPSAFQAECGPDLSVIPNRERVNELGRQCWLARSSRRMRADFVHFPLNGGVVSKRVDAKIVMTLHDLLPLEIPGYLKTESESNAFKARTQKDLDRSDLVFTASEHSRRMIVKTFRLSREPVLAYYGPGLSESDIISSGTSVPDAPDEFFLYVGGYHPRKGVEQLVETHAELYHSGQVRCKLLLVGEIHYYSSEFAKLISAAAHAGSVVELGYVSDQQLVWLLRKARALAYPSLYEGFGLPILEAMKVGCPVLTTGGTSIPEVSGDAAIVIDPRNKRDFGQALKELDSNSALRQDLVQRGRRQGALFSWRKTAEVFLKEITALLHTSDNAV